MSVVTLKAYFQSVFHHRNEPSAANLVFSDTIAWGEDKVAQLHEENGERDYYVNCLRRMEGKSEVFHPSCDR